MAKKPKKTTRGNLGRMIISVVGTLFFFGAALVLAYNSRQAQAAGMRLSTGQNGGSIAPAAGYGIAAIMLLLSFIYGWRARSLLRPRAA